MLKFYLKFSISECKVFLENLYANNKQKSVTFKGLFLDSKIFSKILFLREHEVCNALNIISILAAFFHNVVYK